MDLSNLHIHISNHRIFPRLTMIFMAYMFWEFHQWFTEPAVTELKDWALVQYAAVLSAYVGLVKFYLETGKAYSGSS